MSSNKLISILTIPVLLLNHWILEPLIHLPDGQIGIFRITLIWMIDVICITSAAVWIIKNRARFGSLKKVVFSGILILLMLLFSEGILRVIVGACPAMDRMLSPEAAAGSIEHVLPDPLLGYRGNPDFPEHDARGFRNTVALSTSAIVAIGDSQVYGTSVKRDQPWPVQLSTISGQSVYNMSLGGYGGVQGLILMETEALQLTPKTVVFMMYEGNDAFDAYDAVYNHNLYDPLKLTDPETLKNLGIPEQDNALDANVKEMTTHVWDDKPTPTTRSPTLFSKLKLVQLVSTLKGSVRDALTHQGDQVKPKIAQRNDDPNFVFFEDFSCAGFKTTFTPRYRQLGMNIDDACIREGLRIHLEAIGGMKRLADSKSIRFLVLLLPTKEYAFYDLYDQYHLEPPESIRSTVQLNEVIRKQTIDYLRQHEIVYIDTLPVLRECFAQKQQPFFENADGHLNATGHQAIAKAVAEYIGNENPNTQTESWN